MVVSPPPAPMLALRLQTAKADDSGSAAHARRSELYSGRAHAVFYAEPGIRTMAGEATEWFKRWLMN